MDREVIAVTLDKGAPTTALAMLARAARCVSRIPID